MRYVCIPSNIITKPKPRSPNVLICLLKYNGKQLTNNSLTHLKIVVILQVRRMVQCHIQMVQPISQWQHSAVTQDILFRDLRYVNVKLTKLGVIRPLLVI